MLNIKDLSNPDLPHKENYEQALKIAFEAFKRKDPKWIAEKSAVKYTDDKLIIPHLDKEVILDLKNDSFSVKDADDITQAPIWLAILTLHYLNGADGRTPTGNLKNFREFQDGQFYEPAYNKKTKEVLMAVFGAEPGPMNEAGLKLKGEALKDGDASVKLWYYPLLPITCILWKEDEEFPAEAAVLFDETADIFFSPEDMAVAGQMAVLELLKAAGV